MSHMIQKGAVLLMGFMAMQPNVFAKSTEVEVPAELAFSPSRGFDDNDNVQVVIHGMLPNMCYTLGRSEIQKESGSAYRIKQFAIKKEDGVCLQETTMPPHMQLAVPYTTEISLGQLSMGDYQFEFNSRQGSDKGISVNVASAKAPTVDSLPYASVSSVSVSDLVDSQQDTAVRLEGVLTSSCMVYSPTETKVQKINDVYVVLPLVKIRTDVMCTQSLRPFSAKINLGKLAEGHYLVHVRSMNGKAVNRVVESLIPMN